MHVGVFYSGHAPEAGGGYSFEAEVLRSLMESMDGAKHQFSIICPRRPSAAWANAIAASGMRVAQVPRPGVVGRVRDSLLRDSSLFRSKWRRPSQLDGVVRKLALDLIWFLGAGAHFVDAPYIATVWDLQHRLTPWFPEMSTSGVWDSRELSNAWFLQRATRVITGTEVGKREVEFFYRVPAKRIAILRHPTPSFALRLRRSDGRVLKRYGLSGGYLLYPAQFWPHKNHLALVGALEILRDRYGLTLPLVLVGSDKGTLARVRALAYDKRLHEQVHVLGFVSESDLASLYDHAFALVYVSLCGPENLPPLEAFARGCPVIAADIDGAEEQLADAALRVNARDPHAIAEAVLRLRENEGLRKTLIERGKARAERWTGGDFVRGVFGLLDDFCFGQAAWEPRK